MQKRIWVLIMKFHAFELIKSSGSAIECVMTERDGSAKFFFEETLVVSTGVESQVLRYEIESIKNPIGFIIDKMQRIAERNSCIESLTIDGKSIVLHDNYIEGQESVSAVFFGDEIIPDGGCLVVSILNKDGTQTHNKTYNHEEFVNSDSVLQSPTSFNVPLRTDSNGNPHYTRNTYINQMMFAAKIPLGKDAKKYTALLSNGRNHLKDLVMFAKENNITRFNSALIANVCGYSKQQWKIYGGENSINNLIRNKTDGAYFFPVSALEE